MDTSRIPFAISDKAQLSIPNNSIVNSRIRVPFILRLEPLAATISQSLIWPREIY